jgi:polyhydroxybutyrate depolymerase
VNHDRRRGRIAAALLVVAGLVLMLAGVAQLPGVSQGRPRTPPAVATVPAGWTRSVQTLTVDGMVRRYLVLRPAAVGAARLPVLMELAGNGATPDVEADRAGFAGVTGRAILVYPEGYGLTWDAGNCCGPAMWDHIDDVGFVTAVVRQVLRTQPDADPGRLYLTGYSNGGKMVLLMACAAPTLFTAYAVYGAVNSTPCQDPAPVSLLEVVATGDPELSLPPGTSSMVVNGYAGPSVLDQVGQYLTANGCVLPTGVRNQGLLTTTVWSDCVSGRTVQLSTYLGGSHDWPHGDATTPAAERVMWTFFTGSPGIVSPVAGLASE